MVLSKLRANWFRPRASREETKPPVRDNSSTLQGRREVREGGRGVREGGEGGR